MLLKLPLLTVCSTLLLAVNAQSNCPDVSIACRSDPCSDAVCQRFYNADCRANTCDGLCKPNFYYRGRNVTDRCGHDTCDTRDCGPNRQCMEEVFTSSNCRPNRICRQWLKVRCVLMPTPRPMTCEDIECEEGMMCRRRDRLDRPPVIRCVPIPPTSAPPTPTEQTTGKLVNSPVWLG